MSDPDTFEGIPEEAKYMGEGEDPRKLVEDRQFSDPDFGIQPDRNAPKDAKVKKIPVVEIFGPTIQGEGAMIGVRTTFIRFGLCDYKCTMCDSLHAVLPHLVKQNARWMTQEDIANEIGAQHGILKKADLHSDYPDRYDYWGRQNSDWITFSGGNPCIHDLTELIKRIRGFDLLVDGWKQRIKIAVETQGTKLPDWLSWCDVVTVSPKGPGMGEEFNQSEFMEFLLRFKHHSGFNVKVVVFSQADLEFAKHINGLMIDEGLSDKMYLSLGNPFPPGRDQDMSDELIKLELMRLYDQLSQDILQDPALMNAKFLPQLHVLAWANRQKV